MALIQIEHIIKDYGNDRGVFDVSFEKLIHWCAELRDMKELKVFFLPTVGSLLFNLMISGIACFATCVFNSSAMTTSVGTGLPLLFFLLHIVATFFGSNELLGYCRYFTINSLYSPTDIIACNSAMAVQFLVMFATAAVLFAAGMTVFKKKDLPL